MSSFSEGRRYSRRTAGEDPPPGEIPPTRRRAPNDNPQQVPVAQPSEPYNIPTSSQPSDEYTHQQHPTLMDFLDAQSQFSVETISTTLTPNPTTTISNQNQQSVPANNPSESTNTTSIYVPSDPPTCHIPVLLNQFTPIQHYESNCQYSQFNPEVQQHHYNTTVPTTTPTPIPYPVQVQISTLDNRLTTLESTITDQFNMVMNMLR